MTESFAADVTHDFLQLVLRKAGLRGSRGKRVPFAHMGLAQGRNCLFDLVWAEAHLRGEILDGGVVGDLSQNRVQDAHSTISSR